jgi:2-octaprenyl-6-methoxyphenol hydroxylase
MLPWFVGQEPLLIVWTERGEIAAAMLALDDETFGLEMDARFDSASAASGPPAALRYRCPVMRRYVDHACAGGRRGRDPSIAGQGAISASRVAALAECIVDAQRLGLDPGQSTALERYERWRRFDTMALIAVTDSLNRLFSTDLAPVRLVRDLGLAAVNQIAPLKRLFMRHAMGVVGDLPRLVRGEPL